MKARGRYGVTTICKPCTSIDKRNWRGRNADRNEHLRHDDMPNPELPKRCSRCHQTRQRRDFYISIGTKDGLQGWCKPCIVEENATLIFNRRYRGMGCIGEITTEERHAIYTIQGNRCGRCGIEPTGYSRCLDHVIPAAPGVLNRPSNLQMLCRACHARKKQRTNDYRKPEWLAAWPPD